MTDLLISLASLAVCVAAYIGIRRQRVALEKALSEPRRMVETSTSLRTSGDETIRIETVVARSPE